jgi:hypothetical protein
VVTGGVVTGGVVVGVTDGVELDTGGLGETTSGRGVGLVSTAAAALTFET